MNNPQDNLKEINAHPYKFLFTFLASNLYISLGQGEKRLLKKTSCRRILKPNFIRIMSNSRS
jgi:hypothetical protein